MISPMSLPEYRPRIVSKCESLQHISVRGPTHAHVRREHILLEKVQDQLRVHIRVQERDGVGLRRSFPPQHGPRRAGIVWLPRKPAPRHELKHSRVQETNRTSSSGLGHCKIPQKHSYKCLCTCTYSNNIFRFFRFFAADSSHPMLSFQRVVPIEPLLLHSMPLSLSVGAVIPRDVPGVFLGRPAH